MGWVASFAVAVLTAVLAMFGSGLVASLAVDWYSISSFEGGSGYFVIGMSLLGLIGGFVIGLVAARVVAARPNPTFLKGLGAACGTVATILFLIGGGARLLAHVPPEIDGETLFLQVELRWPENGLPAPASIPGAGYLRLGSSTGSVVGATEDGPLFVEDARQVDGRWIVPGAVWIFTSRGQRLLMTGIGETDLGGFVVPLPAHPGAAHQQWSDWLPHAAPGQPALPDQLTFRFRVARTSEALRTTRVGGFEIQTIVNSFSRSSDPDGFNANSRFRVLHGGQPLAGGDEAGAVAVLGGPRPGLLIQRTQPDGASECSFVSDESGAPAVTPIGTCTLPMEPRPLTSDQRLFAAARDAKRPSGWVDWHTLSRPGLFQMNDYVLDTRSHGVRRFTRPPGSYPISDVPPLGLSPDERSFITFGHDGSSEQPVLMVTDAQADRTYTVAIDRQRMRFNDYDLIDPDWVLHHFEWHRESSDADTLRARDSFVPLPYRGQLTLGKPGEYMSYTVRPGGEPLRAAVVGILQSSLGAERLEDRLDGYEQRLRLGDHTLLVTVVETPGYVNVTMDYGKSDAETMKRIAAAVDSALATGKYDGAFAATTNPS